MNSMDPLSTITLVVKAPNQRIADQTVECAAGWTVKKLKNHLSNVYPSKPHEKDQKIIYSGRLLHDHLTLKDILRQYEDTVAYTVHLVCATALGGSLDTGNLQTSDGQSVNDDGTALRHRVVPNAQNTIPYQQPLGNFSAFHMAQLQQQQHHQQQQQQYNNMYLTPYQQQVLWMQQLYTQQHMAQYMQYMNQSNMVQNMESPVEEVPANQIPIPQAPVNENQANNQPANQNVRMNAGVGPPMDDEEEQFNRDWLDWVYVLSRFSLLLSIVYFYSSIDRFLLVMGFVAIMYLYQGGWFRVRRRQIRRNTPVVPPQPANPPPQEAPTPPENPVEPDEGQPQPESSDNTNIDDSNINNDHEEQNSENSNNDSEQQEPQEPQPSVVETAWNFVSSFFTSLIPQGPGEFPN